MGEKLSVHEGVEQTQEPTISGRDPCRICHFITVSVTRGMSCVFASNVSDPSIHPMMRRLGIGIVTFIWFSLFNSNYFDGFMC